MNTLSLIARIKEELDDQGVFYTDEDIFDSLQDGYEEISLRTECIEKVVSISFPATPYLDVPTLVPDYFRPFGIYDRNQKLFLTPTTFKILESFDEKWETTTGTPEWFVPLDFKYIAFYPYYATVPVYNLYLFYSAVAPDFTSSNTLDIPANHENVILNYVVNDLLDQALEFKKSGALYGEYISDVTRLKSELGKRNNSDRIKQFLVKINANVE